MVMTLLGREVPDCKPEWMLTDEKLAYLIHYARRHQLAAPICLGNAMKAVAHLGGYQVCKGEAEPGHQIMWHSPTR